MDGRCVNVLTCQSPYGGFGKLVRAMPDLLHSFYSLSWLALSREQGCCEEDNKDSSGTEEQIANGERGKDWHDIEMRQQVCESIDRLSKLDFDLGMCTKGKPAFQRESWMRNDFKG
ncbi:hypothetical protein ACHAXR_003359 [Thalassiosira sp. AJA248-18]